MSPFERQKLITDWIAMHHLPEDSEEYKRHLWAERELTRLTSTDPDLCFELILAILDQDQSDRVLSNLAAGPLEDVLSEHGEHLIGRVEQHAREDARFRRLLGGVWQGDMTEDIWRRVRAIAPERW